MSVNSIEVIVDNTNVDVVVAPSQNISLTTSGGVNVEVSSAGLPGAIGLPSGLTVGTTTTGDAGTNAALTITGTAPNQVANFTIPRGNTGVAGPSNTLTLGTVTTLLPAQAPTVAITGTSPTQTINFGLPASAKWLSGAGVPATGTGVVGDWYINTTTSDYYEKTAAAVWTLRGNLKGLTGNTGPANTLSIAGVTTGAEGSNATITIAGTSPNQNLTFAIPRGNTGPANVLSVGTIATGAAGSSVIASITGTAPAQTLNLTIPRGDTGLTGPANTLTIGTVSTVAVGGSATASITGTAPNQTLNIGIPTGATGATGLAGSRWYQGSGPPSGAIGVLNDYYLNTNTSTGTGDVYQKTGASAWTLIGNIRGLPGAGNVVTVNGDAGPNVIIDYASLGVIPASSLPPLAINEWFVAADQAAMLALTAQRGDMVKRTDTGQVFFLASDSPSTLADWKEVSDNAPVTSVAGRIGDIVLTKTDVGLNLVDNTADSAKPVSTAQQTALNLKANLASPTFTGTVSGITATMVGLGNVPNLDMRNISNVTSGTIPDAQLPDRLKIAGANLTDFNLLIETGFYRNASAATNGPPSGGFFYGTVWRSGIRVNQTFWDITKTSADTKKWQRESNDTGATWNAWYRVRESEAELDTRYSLGTHNHDSVYMNLTTAQTIAGIKTFSSSPSVPVNSWTIASTAGLQAALDAKAIDTAVVHLAGTETITGSKTFSSTITMSNIGVANDSSYNTYSASIGSDVTLGPLGFQIGMKPSATGANRYAYISVGDSIGMRNLILNFNGSTAYGRVGIGMSAPVEMLDVAGNIKSSGSISGVTATFSSTTTTAGILVNGYLDQAMTGTLGAVAGNYVTISNQRFAGSTNNFQNLVLMHRSASSPTDWTTAEMIDGIAVDASFLTPTTIRNYIKRNPSTQSTSIGSNGIDQLILSPAALVSPTGLLQLTNATNNVIQFASAGFSAPTFTTRSAGTKLVLYTGTISGSAAEYAIGIDGSTLWNSVPSNGQFFKWYGGTTSVMTLTGSGALSTVGTMTNNGGTITPWMEIGNQSSGSATTAFIDFHSGATFTDYDVRISATGGNGTNAAGQLQILANGGLNIDGITSIHNGSQVFNIKAGTQNHVYMGLYARDNVTRTAWFGYGSNGATTLTISNEIAGGAIGLTTNNGALVIATGTQNTNISGNAIVSSAPLYLTSGGSAMTIQSTAPQIQFTDTDTVGAGKNFWLHLNGGQFYILRDGDGDGNWEPTYPFIIGPTGAMALNANGGDITLTAAQTFAIGKIVAHNTNASQDFSVAALQTRNDSTSAFPSIAFHRSGAFAPQLRAVDGTTFQFVNQTGSTLVDLHAAAVRSYATANSLNVQRFIFTVAGAARPVGSAYVEWVGPVAPTNAIDGDTWVSTA